MALVAFPAALAAFPEVFGGMLNVDGLVAQIN